MEDFILKQLFQQPQEVQINKNFEFDEERESEKNWHSYFRKKLFIRIYDEVRKKLKRGNQYKVAMEIKRIFETAEKLGTFEYCFSYERIYDPELERFRYVDLTAYEYKLRRRHQYDLRKNYLRQIGLNRESALSSYAYHHSDYFANYYGNATPEAIIQKRKRIIKSNK